MTDELDFEIVLESETPGGELVAHTVSSGLLVDQHSETVGLDIGGSACVGSQAMQTLRVPLTDYSDQGQFDPSRLTALRLRFLEDANAHNALIDSLELTRDPDGGTVEGCPQGAGNWNCIAAAALTATETSCAGEPVQGCDPADVQVNGVAIPHVSGAGGGHDGWVVHIPKGWVNDSANPTPAELDDIAAACEDACELEWSDNPDVAATCGAAGAFATPTLREVPGIAPEHRIASSSQDGSGLFTGQALSCNLEGDCCEAFDEDLCAARLTRSTAARQPRRRGEETRVAVGGAASKVTFVTPGASVAMPLAGTAGYSMCDGSGTCPFYVGSLSVSGTSAVTVADTCPDLSPFSMQVTDFDVELLQPAFGVADAGSNDKAFPSGALYVQGFITIDGQSYTVRAVNEDPVFLAVSAGGFFAGDLDINVDVPCGGGTLPITLEIDLRHTGSPIGRPPTISITSPSQIQCPGTLPLTHNAADTDGDLTSVRWYVDDVLVAPAVTSIAMTQGHTLRAVARDARGATTTATQAVTCN